MNEYFVSNRDVIKNFTFNTVTSANPVFTNMCTASELTLNTDFNETTFGISAKVKGSLDGSLKSMDSFDCVQFPKDMFRDIQIARKAANNDFGLLKEQSDYYEKTLICDLISERCDINTTTDNYFKELLVKQPALLGS